jgi:hypothetical protein
LSLLAFENRNSTRLDSPRTHRGLIRRWFARAFSAANREVPCSPGPPFMPCYATWFLACQERLDLPFALAHLGIEQLRSRRTRKSPLTVKCTRGLARGVLCCLITQSWRMPYDLHCGER